MELEKIRAADTSVRWQDDEDVDNCPSCKTNFTVTRRKVIIHDIHIRHFQSVFSPFLVSNVFIQIHFIAAKLPSLWHNLL